jgi:tetratricopeptide (TPR) repeat protein
MPRPSTSARPRDAEPGRSSKTQERRAWAVPIALFLLVLAAYGPALGGDFINMDDTHGVSENEAVTQSSSPVHFWVDPPDNEYWWPVTYSILWGLWHGFGGDPAPFHWTNALLHALNAWLLYHVLGQYRAGRRWRFLSAALFAVHPAHTAAVAWIIQLKSVSSTALFLLGFAAYQRAEDPRAAPGARRWAYGSSLALFVLSALAKTSTVMWPAALAIHHGLMNRWDARRMVQRLWPHALAAAVLAWLTATMSARFVESGALKGVLWHPTILERCLTAALNFWFYVSRLLVPEGYAFLQPFRSAQATELRDYLPLLALGAAALAVVYAAWNRRAFRPAALGLAFYAVNLVPTLGFVITPFMRYSLVADHYQYLASLGAIAVMASAAEALASRIPWKHAGAAVLVVAAFAGVLLTRSRAQAFEDSETLWRAAIEDNPGSDLAHYNLGVHLGDDGRTDEAIVEYRRAIELNPKKVEALVNLGKIALDRGDLDEAERNYLGALSADPGWASAHFGLGVLRQTQSRLPEALEAYGRALSLKPKLTDALSNKCVVLLDLGRLDEAEQACSRALGIDPNHRAALQNKAALMLRMDRLTEALPLYERLAALHPEDTKVLLRIGYVAGRLGERDRARAALEEVLAREPDNADARILLVQLGPR